MKMDEGTQRRDDQENFESSVLRGKDKFLEENQELESQLFYTSWHNR